MPALLENVVRKRRKTLILVMALSFTLVVASGVGFYFYVLNQWQSAKSAVRDGRFSDARRNLDFCLFVWPRSVSVHLLAARAARLSGDFETAEVHLNQCLKLQKGDKDDIQLEFLLMRAQTGEEDSVAPLLKNLVDNNHPETPLILKTLARAYMHSLRYGFAFECLDRWAREEPNSALPFHWRGWVRERLNQAPAALSDYKHALDLDPGIVPVRLRIGEMYLEDHNPVEAAPYLELLFSQFPDRSDIQARLGQCRFLQGQEKEARRLLEAAVVEMPNDPAVLLYLAKTDLQDDDPSKAEERLRHLLKIEPFDTEGRYTHYLCLEKLGRHEEAAVALGKWQQDKDQLERANHLLKEEASHPSKDAQGAFEIGNALLQVNQENLGLYWLNKALDRDNTFSPALKALAEHYEKKGASQEAARYRRLLGDTAGKKQ